jgi:holo-[acyl-carrier protein] synthase
MITGIGVDISQIDVIRGPLTEVCGAFVNATFTPREIEQCRGQKGHDEVLHFAGKYAAKEALIKALGPAYAGLEPDVKNFDYREIEVLTDPVSGPRISLSGRLAEVQWRLGFQKIWVSISHETQNAVAMVILET